MFAAVTQDDPHFRRSARERVELGVRFRRDHPDATLEKTGHLVDLSIGGALITADGLPQEGERLRVTLVAPTAWDPLDLPAEVRWVKTNEECFGVEFVALSGSESSALYALISITRFWGEAR